VTYLSNCSAIETNLAFNSLPIHGSR